MEKKKEKILAAVEAAKYLGLTEPSLRQYRYVNKPKIPYIKDDVTCKVYYKKTDLDKYIISLKHPAGNLKTPKQIYQELGITVEKFWRYAIKLQDKLKKTKIRNRVYFAKETPEIIKRECMF